MNESDTSLVLSNLSDTYLASRQAFEKSNSVYQEAEARSEFIDPFLESFGWDVNNKSGLIHSAREVLREESQKTENAKSKKPDYTLRIGGQRKVFVEAKKPSIDILTSQDSIQQARSYGYTANHPIVILTNFKNLAIYDTSQPPEVSDPPEAYRLFQCEFSEYVSKFQEIHRFIGRNAVGSPEWESSLTAGRSVGSIQADDKLLSQISKWKIDIAEDILSRHSKLSSRDLDLIAQKLINRLLFIRMCEDRGIEGESFLKSVCSSEDFDVREFFEELNKRYNSGLFDLNHAPSEPSLLLSSSLVNRFVQSLYAPYSPFSFSVLGAELLGLVYENSLTEHLVVKQENGNVAVALEKKREFLRRDVVATPQLLVESTVRDGINAIRQKPLSQIKVLDFAIGSGRFLVSAFNQVSARIVDERIQNKDFSDLEKIGIDSWKLNFQEKCKLLKENFFGIDVDFNAVEVAKFSLLVNLLDDESNGTLPKKKKLLPRLDSNIIHGNTLVKEPLINSGSAVDQTFPLDWGHTILPVEFDLIVGNPPYMKTEDMKTLNKEELEYLKNNYEFAYKQFDKYMPFVELSISKVSASGAVAIVIPNKWMTIVSGRVMRDNLRKNSRVRKLANFRALRVFEEKDTYVCSLVLSGGSSAKFEYLEPTSFETYLRGSDQPITIQESDFEVFQTDSWALPKSIKERKVLEALSSNSVPLGELLETKNGIQTSRDKLFVIKEAEIVSISQDILTFQKNGKKWTIELDITKPFLDDSKRVRSYETLETGARVIYPYQSSSVSTNGSGFEPIPESELLDAFPMTFEYFKQNISQLAVRQMGTTDDSMPFYRFGRTQSIGSAPRYPKIIYSVNQRGDKYSIDETGIVYASGGTAGIVGLYPKNLDYSLDFFLALLSQSSIEFFNRKRGSPFQGGYFARGTSVIQDVPVPKLDFENQIDIDFHARVSESYRKIRDLTSRKKSANARDLGVINQTISQTISLISEAFNARWGLSAEISEELLG